MLAPKVHEGDLEGLVYVRNAMFTTLEARVTAQPRAAISQEEMIELFRPATQTDLISVSQEDFMIPIDFKSIGEVWQGAEEFLERLGPDAAMDVVINARNQILQRAPEDEAGRNFVPEPAPFPPEVAERMERRVRLAEERLDDLRAEVNKDEELAAANLLDGALKRYLRAHDGDVKGALKGLSATHKWRESLRNGKDIVFGDAGSPIRYKCLVCPKDPTAHCFFKVGWDVYNRVIMYSCPGYAKDIGIASQVSHVISEFEAHLGDGDIDPSCIVWVVDFGGFGVRHTDPRVGYHTVSLFAHHYPERLGELILLGFPKLFRLFWSIVYPAIDAVTRAKLHILDKESQQIDYFDKHFSFETKRWIQEVRAMNHTAGATLPSIKPDEGAVDGVTLPRSAAGPSRSPYCQPCTSL